MIAFIRRLFTETKSNADAEFLRDCAQDYRRAGDHAEAQVLERIAKRLEREKPDERA